MTPGEVLLLALPVSLAAFWWDSLQKREIALQAARRACEQAGVQFLDESVALKKMTLRRDEDMRTRLYREFGFEYSSAGDDRQAGRIYLLGNRVLSADLIL